VCVYVCECVCVCVCDCVCVCVCVCVCLLTNVCVVVPIFNTFNPILHTHWVGVLVSSVVV
jgi:hypothetical protein